MPDYSDLVAPAALLRDEIVLLKLRCLAEHKSGNVAVGIAQERITTLGIPWRLSLNINQVPSGIDSGVSLHAVLGLRWHPAMTDPSTIREIHGDTR